MDVYMYGLKKLEDRWSKGGIANVPDFLSLSVGQTKGHSKKLCKKQSVTTVKSYSFICHRSSKSKWFQIKLQYKSNTVDSNTLEIPIVGQQAT